MANIHMRRDHALGLKRARELAWAWAEQVEQKFELECTVLEGKTSDTVEFRRPGVSGELEVAAEYFELNARLGLLMGAFKGKIEREIEAALDKLLAAEGSAKKPAAKAKKKAG